MSAYPDRLPIAVRAYTPPTTPPKARKRTSWKRPSLTLVFDTETSTDPTQRLRFGVYRVYKHKALIEEGIFTGDDLSAAECKAIAAYAATQRTETPDRAPLRVLTRRAFLADVFWRVAFKYRALVVGFNLPFDLARLAVGSGAARGPRMGGGFSLTLWDYERDGVWQEDRFRPRVTVKAIDSKRSLIGFTKRRSPDDDDLIPEGSRDGKPDPGYVFPGHFLDLRTLAFALTNQSHSLKSACEAFGVVHGKLETDGHGTVTPDYLDYARRDVLATWELAVALLAELDRHPIPLPPTKALSPATVGKHYLAAMGIQPPLVRWPEMDAAPLGRAMSAYYGGRAEAHIRKTPVPVVYLDFLSMYPTVNALMGLWSVLIAERVAWHDATEDVRTLLAGVTLERCFEPSFWRELPVLVQIAPDGDTVPVRARYTSGGQSWGIGLNVLAGGEPRWYTLADCVASTLLTGKPPMVLQALCLVPEGVQPGLNPVSLRGAVRVDPTDGDFFRTVIELRKSLPDSLPITERKRLEDFLKVLANSTSYGIFAEMNRQERGGDRRQPVTVYGLDPDPFETAVLAPEEPGAWCFPPLAAFIAGAARLMLALLECGVTELGGTFAMADTDSMAIVATEQGGLMPCPGGAERFRRKPAIRALSWSEVEGIRDRFAHLNPYDPDLIPGSVLKLEEVNRDEHEQQRQVWCLATSAKRYCLYTLDEDGEPQLVKWSEHGLGHLLNPTDPDGDDRDWMRQLWEGIVRKALGLAVTWPAWLDRPALSRLTVSSPELLRPFSDLNAGKGYADQVKPFSFMLVGHVPPLSRPAGADPARFQLVAPYETDPRKWLTLEWIDRYSGKRIPVTTDPLGQRPMHAHLQTYGDVLGAFQTHPEAKSADAMGKACTRRTVGLLRRRVVQETYVAHVGKEANKLELVEVGFEHDPEAVLTEYTRPGHDHWSAVVLPLLRDANLREVAEATGVSSRQLRTLVKGDARPHRKNQAILERYLAEYACLPLCA